MHLLLLPAKRKRIHNMSVGQAILCSLRMIIDNYVSSRKCQDYVYVKWEYWSAI